MPLNFGKSLIDMLPMIAIIVVMIVVTILPQRKRSKEVKKMMDEMKRGDWVKTIGGVVGRVTNIKEGEKDTIVTLETGPGRIQIDFTRGAIASVGNAEVEAEGLSQTEVNTVVKGK